LSSFIHVLKIFRTDSSKFLFRPAKYSINADLDSLSTWGKVFLYSLDSSELSQSFFSIMNGAAKESNQHLQYVVSINLAIGMLQTYLQIFGALLKTVCLKR
jgi:hypothetical protein